GGKYAISGLSDSAINEMVSSLALQAERAGSVSGAGIKKPRIGLYRPWQASMDEGWTRWVLEQYGFDFVSLVPADFHGGALQDRLDVVLVAGEGGGPLDGCGQGRA